VHHDLLVSYASAAKFSSSVALPFGRRPRFFTPHIPRARCPGRRGFVAYCVAAIAGAFWPAHLLSSPLRRLLAACKTQEAAMRLVGFSFLSRPWLFSGQRLLSSL
jgi:hypothetical protein